VRKKDNITGITQLSGKKIATPDKLAVISMMAKIFFEKNGLQPGKDISIHHTESHGNAILSVYNGNADAAVVSAGVFERMPDDVKSKLTVLTKTHQIPHVMFMAKKQLPEKQYKQIKKAMLAFTADSHGKAFFNNNRRGDMIDISDEDMETLRPYVDILKQQLK
jgi:ABC-type phosphate/phosphonate transport system substrate-binding protein